MTDSGTPSKRPSYHEEVQASEVQALFEHIRGSNLTDDQCALIAQILTPYECNLWEDRLPQVMSRSDFEELARLSSFEHWGHLSDHDGHDSVGVVERMRICVRRWLQKADTTPISRMTDLESRYPSDVIDILRRAMISTKAVSAQEKQRIDDYRHDQLGQGAVAPPLPARLCAQYREREGGYLHAATRGGNASVSLYDDETLVEIRMILMISLHPLYWGVINEPQRSIVWSDTAHTYRATGDQLAFLQKLDYLPAMPAPLYDRLSELLSQRYK